MQRIAQTVLNSPLVFGVFHVDKVDHDQTTQVAQTQLAGDFVSRFLVGAQSGFFDVGTACCARRVHVDGNQGFGVINHNRAARRQVNRTRICRFNLVLNLEAREQRHVVTIAFDARHIVRHHNAHERHRLIGDIVRIDQDFADFRREVIADRANHQTGFEVNQDGGGIVFGRAINGGPELHQIGQVPLKFFDVTADTGGAGDDAHSLGNIELIHRLAQFLTVFAFNAA